MYKKILLCALAAMMLLALGAGTAGANRSLSSTETIITLLSPAVSLGAFGGTQVICEVGVTITLRARAIAKVIGSQIGNAQFLVLRCSRNNARVLPVVGGNPVFYNGFTGTLPEITGLDRLRVNGVEFLVEISGIGNCLIRTNATGFQRITRGAIGDLIGDSAGGQRFRLESETVRTLSGICPGPGSIELSGTFRPVRGTTIGLL